MLHNNTVLEAMQNIRSTASAMRSDSRFKIVFEEYPKVDEEDFSEWEQWIRKQPGMRDYRVPEEIRMLYSQCGGFLFQWQYLPAKSKLVVGSAEIVTILELYQRDDEYDKPVATLLETPRQFDIISDTEYVSVGLSRDDELTLFYFNEERNTRKKIDIGMISYVQRLSENYAIYGWQSSFIPRGRTLTDSQREWEKTVKHVVNSLKDT